MIFIIPLCGKGTRFYPQEKIYFPVLNKPLIYYLINSLKLKSCDTLIIPYREDIDITVLKNLVKASNFSKIFFYPLSNTLGAAHTLKLTLENFKNKIDLNEGIISLDGDNFCENFEIVSDSKNVIYYYETRNSSQIFSTISFDENNILSEISEKSGKTNNICIGAYQFSNYKTFKEAYEKCYKNSSDNFDNSKNYFDNSHNSLEYFTSNLFNHISQVYCQKVNNFYCLGTPLQVEIFSPFFLHKKQRNIHLLKNNLTSDNISVLKKWGHKIFTTCEKIEQSEGIFSKEIEGLLSPKSKIDFTLNEIPDISFNCRPSHNIKILDGKIVKRSCGPTLKYQSYYYYNIPEIFSSYFPKIYSSINEETIILEKINGLSGGELYVKNLLNEKELLKMINILDSFHKLRNIPNSFSIYEKSKIDNFIKLEKRLNHHNYEKLKLREEFSCTLNFYKSFFTKYDKNLSNLCFIHGDAVLSNILWDNFGALTFVDPRGNYLNSLGEEVYSIYGDEYYDWAKLYQSLTGYENIIREKNSNNYLADFFLDKIKEMGKNTDFIKIITSSLYFSLIPFHNEKLTEQFFDKSLEIIKSL